MVAHLKKKSKFKISYEKLDDQIVAQLNEMKDDYIKNFHKDNFLDFKNISIQLKKKEMLANIDQIRRSARRKGYYIK